MTTHNHTLEGDKSSRTPSRREFLTRGAILAGGTMIFGLPFLTGRTRSTYAALQGQALEPGRYALVLSGQVVGFLNSVESGFVSGTVVAQQLGNEPNMLKKHWAAITYEDISVQCGGNMSPEFYQWIQSSMNSQSNSMNGTVLKTDMSYQVIEEKVFQNASITEITFPALDGASNEPFTFNVTFKPQHTILQPGPGSQISFPPQPHAGNLLSSNFRLNIQGLENACAFVQHIEPLVWKRSLGEAQTGSFQEHNAALQPLEIPDLVISLPESQAGPFAEWFQDFVIQGHTTDDQEKPGILELLAPDHQQVLFTISFGHLGIFRMSPIPSSNHGQSLVKIEMYCETMQFAQGPMGSSSAHPQSAPPQPSPPPPSSPPPPRGRRPIPRQKKSTPIIKKKR